VPGHEVLKKWADVSQRKPLKSGAVLKKFDLIRLGIWNFVFRTTSLDRVLKTLTKKLIRSANL
jgi:hypothetical protein